MEADPVFRGTLVTEAQEFIVTHRTRKNGIGCPCCERKVKEYERQITTPNVKTMIWMYKYHQQYGRSEWIHLSGETGGSGSGWGSDFAKVRHWGLVEMKREYRKDGSNRNGYWRLTRTGRLFVRGELAIPKYVYLLNNEVIGVSNTKTTIQQSLGTKFNYDELMAKTVRK